MPSDANGVYSLPPGYLAASGAKIRPSQHNPIFEDIAAALTARMPKSGAAPMTGPFLAVGGAAATPGIAFDGAANFGFFKTAAGIGMTINGVLVFDFTADTAGTLRKTARYIGELIPWSRVTPPTLCVFPFGQTLSRTTYADLWVVAQAEIAAGNAFYNNGDGSTTFGIGDLRGRVLAAKDDMGGTPAGRLTTAGSGVDGLTLGAAGGAQTRTLTTPNLPPYTPAGTITDGTITISGGTTGAVSGTTAVAAAGHAFADVGSAIAASQSGTTFTGTAQGGTSTPIVTVQPTLVTNFALFAGA